MQIDFYEEFPTKKNLEKIKLVNWKSRVFIASKSIEHFKKLKKQVKETNKNIKTAYWPLLKSSYWVSPFSDSKELKKLLKRLDKNPFPLLIDLELPLNKRFILKNLPYFFKNRKTIKEFLKNNKKRTTTAEFPSSIFSYLMRLLGLDYSIKTEKSLMFYTSMLPKPVIKNIKKHLTELKKKKQHSISLGVIAKGILGNEKILKPEQLEKDLKFAKKAGFEKIIIFRLGGLNKKYLKVIKKFL